MEQDGKIDRKSMEAYKANLGLLSSRYTQVETRVLEKWAREFEDGGSQDPETYKVEFPGGSAIAVQGLVSDSIITRDLSKRTLLTDIQGLREYYVATEKGLKLINDVARAALLG